RRESLPDQLVGQGEYGREHHGENAALRVWRSIASLLPQGSWLLPGGYPSQRGAIPWGIFFALPGVAPFQFVVDRIQPFPFLQAPPGADQQVGRTVPG